MGSRSNGGISEEMKNQDKNDDARSIIRMLLLEMQRMYVVGTRQDYGQPSVWSYAA